MTPTYLDRLAARSATVGTVLCVGIDPDPATLPDGFTADLAGVEQFACLLVEAAAPFAAAIKPNLASVTPYYNEIPPNDVPRPPDKPAAAQNVQVNPAR